jgi:hypothetical protein
MPCSELIIVMPLVEVESAQESRTEINGLWLRVLTQYLFHSKPRSSVSRLDLKIWTSNE